MLLFLSVPTLYTDKNGVYFEVLNKFCVLRKVLTYKLYSFKYLGALGVRLRLVASNRLHRKTSFGLQFSVAALNFIYFMS